MYACVCIYVCIYMNIYVSVPFYRRKRRWARYKTQARATQTSAQNRRTRQFQNDAAAAAQVRKSERITIRRVSSGSDRHST